VKELIVRRMWVARVGMGWWVGAMGTEVEVDAEEADVDLDGLGIRE